MSVWFCLPAVDLHNEKATGIESRCEFSNAARVSKSAKNRISMSKSRCCVTQGVGVGHAVSTILFGSAKIFKVQLRSRCCVRGVM